MTIISKIKTIDNKINQNKAQYKQTANMFALTSGHVSKYELLTGKDVHQRKMYSKKLLDPNNSNIYH